MQILVIAPGKKQTFACRRLLIWQIVNTSRGPQYCCSPVLKSRFSCLLINWIQHFRRPFWPYSFMNRISILFYYYLCFFFIFTCPNAKSDKNKFGIATKESFFNSKESLIVNIYCRNTCPYCYHYSLCCNFNLDVGSVLQSSPFLKLLMKKLVTLCEPSTCYDDFKRT